MRVCFFKDTTFLDFIRGGLRLHLIVAVDFTLSNGDPANTESLHYYDRNRPDNPYTMAIKAIGDIFQDYDYGKRQNILLKDGRGCETSKANFPQFDPSPSCSKFGPLLLNQKANSFLKLEVFLHVCPDTKCILNAEYCSQKAGNFLHSLDNVPQKQLLLL